MNLFFVYDTTYCKADEDDPKDAVIYFFPSQTSDSQHYLLCCQLAGIAKFLKTTFSSPSVIGLDEGKFAFLWSGKYLLVLGASSHVKTSVLHDQLLFLCGIFCFYHGSLDNIHKECKDRQEYLAKLELAWSRYISLSQRFGNILQISLSALPMVTYKKNSGVVTTANRLLHMCQMSSYVVAGAVFYNSRILSTQFMPQLTNYLSLLSNSNASAPVTDAAHFIRNLPPDVELKTVYLSSKCLSSILKHNHTYAGSRIRMKTVKSRQRPGTSLPNEGEPINSGSEGDVDSGNFSEIPHSNRGGAKMKKMKPFSCFKHKNSLPCCSGHSRLLVKNLSGSRNHISLKLIADINSCKSKLKSKDPDDSGFHFSAESTNYYQKHQSNFKAANVLCHAHAQLLASSFVSESKLKHTNFSSSCDSEFRCSVCFSFQNFLPFFSASLKQWNSEKGLSDSIHDTCNLGYLLNFWDCSDHLPTETTKVQLLKCRHSSGFCRRTFRSQGTSKRSVSDPLDAVKKSTGAVPKAGSNSLSHSLDDAENLESNKLHKHVLFVQRYGGATLLLLLNKAYDEKVVNYLWNCGFTVLRDLEFDNDKQNSKSLSACLDSSFYTLLYNHAQQTLKEYPHSPASLLTGKHVKETVQDIQQHFLSDPQFKMISLLSGNQGIFAAQKDHQSLFYLEQDMNAKRLDALDSLGKKAARRLEKLFKISI